MLVVYRLCCTAHGDLTAIEKLATKQ